MMPGAWAPSRASSSNFRRELIITREPKGGADPRARESRAAGQVGNTIADTETACPPPPPVSSRPSLTLRTHLRRVSPSIAWTEPARLLRPTSVAATVHEFHAIGV